LDREDPAARLDARLPDVICVPLAALRWSKARSRAEGVAGGYVEVNGDDACGLVKRVTSGVGLLRAARWAPA
jgi:hypothetical protein